MKFDGHMMRNGVKYLATDHYNKFNHYMKPEQVDWFTGYHHRVNHLALNDFRNMLAYKNLTDWTPHWWQEWEIERFFMES